LAVFLKAAVAAAVALFVSTFASSTLFTIIVSLVVYFIGHAQSLALDYYFAEGEIPSATQRFFAGLIGVVFPNFQLFNVTDGLTAGEVVSASLMTRLVGLTAFYLTIYSLVSWLIFAKKEL
jgi:hypothetical protein